MTGTIWPRYRSFAGRTAVLAVRFGLRQRTLLHLLQLVALVAVYFLAIFIRVPVLSVSAAGSHTWWFRSFLDEIFTGGAFGRCSVLSLGNFAIPLLYLGRPGPLLVPIRLAGLLTAAGICTALFVSQGEIRPAFVPVAACVACLAAGGWIVYFIDKHLLIARGPDVLHLNIFFWIARSAWLSHRIEWYSLPVPIVIAVSAFYLFRDEKLIQILNIKTKSSARVAALALRSLNETSLETFATYVMIFFVTTGGLVSLLAGWRDLAAAPLLLSLSISLATFVIATFMFSSLRRKLSHLAHPEIPAFGALVGPDPVLLAQRMLDHYWIVEGVQAGEPTRAYLENVVRRQWRKTLLLLATWLALAAGLQACLRQHGIYAFEFGFGPLIYVALATMAVTNLSMLANELRARFSGFRQLQQGQLRVADGIAPSGAEEYFLQTARRAAAVELDRDDREYWSQQHHAEELNDILNWYQLVRLEGRPALEKEASESRTATIVRQALLRFVLATFLAAVTGIIYALLKPADGDFWAVVVPVFTGALFTPEAIMAMARKRNRSE